jgi:hypothetical protein
VSVIDPQENQEMKLTDLEFKYDRFWEAVLSLA